jgi:hypothetical protein
MIKILDRDTNEDITNAIDVSRKRSIEDTQLKILGCLSPERLTQRERDQKLQGVIVKVPRTQKLGMFFE